MKEYLENRIEELKVEYNDALGQVSKSNSENVHNPLWKDVDDKKSRLDETRLTLKFFLENNYTNS